MTPARIRASIQLRGPNIYSSATVTREVYTLRAQVRPGNSGGPLLAPDGTVLGVIFGAAIDETDVGFALTAEEVAPVVEAGLDRQLGGVDRGLHSGLTAAFTRARSPGLRVTPGSFARLARPAIIVVRMSGDSSAG